MPTDLGNTASPNSYAALRDELLTVVRERGYRYREKPFALSSGGTSHDYVDMRVAVSEGHALRLAADTLITKLSDDGLDFDAIGGMTMGADPVAHAVALVKPTAWYSVRKATKDHGSEQRIEGTPLSKGVRVVVFEDTVSTGRSVLDVLDVVEASGATVVTACTLLDRGDAATAAFAKRGVPYFALLSYRDLGIDPLGGPSNT